MGTASKYGLILVASLTATVLVFAGGAQAQQADRGEQIMNATCSGCHDLRTIQTQAKDKDGWTKTVAAMIDNGAEFKNEEERVILTDYLVANFGPLPDGPGKAIVLNICTMCHDLTRIKRSRHTADEWEDVLSTMLNEGAPLSDDDFPIVLNYLAKSFGVE
jgi:cytochrome c5